MMHLEALDPPAAVTAPASGFRQRDFAAGLPLGASEILLVSLAPALASFRVEEVFEPTQGNRKDDQPTERQRDLGCHL
jgi:hypothetical protein